MDEERRDEGQKLEQLEGVVESVTFHNEENGFTVLCLRSNEDGDAVTVVGALAGVAPGEQLLLTGRFVEHRAYGPQFEAASCAYLMPESEEDILRYLSSGVLPGIGPAIAKRVVGRFGAEALEILAREPEKLGQVKGFSPEKAREAGRRFMELFGAREAIVGLARLGLSAPEALAAYRQFGKATLEAVEDDPYRLCAWPLYISFARADAIAAALGKEPGSAERVRAALLYTLRHNLRNGHTCLPREKLLATAAGFFEVRPEAAAAELEAAEAAGQTQGVSYRGVDYVYLAEPFRAEMSAALRLRLLAAQPPAPPESVEKAIAWREAAEGISYAPRQKEAIAEALSHGAMVITGGPGTGKTTAVNAVIALYEQEARRVLLAAPTGRAAKRMSELTGRRAATIHRLLEAEFAGGQEQARFKRNAKNPLRCDVLIVDEMSMVDVFLFESLLDALPKNCRLIMVGDADQLPSVGPGNVLRGIIASGVAPVVALTEIFRQAAASLIVKNAHRIVEGQMPASGTKADDWFFLRSEGLGCQRLVCELAARRLPASYGFSPLGDIQVLCPSRVGPLGTEALNAELQAMLNPPAPGKPELRRYGITFRLGDKVMQVRNNYDIPYTKTDGEGGAGAFNGDIGVITRISPAAGSMTVLCDDRHVEYGMDELHELELAWAVTIHKSQGSEFEAVVIPLSETPGRLQYRNLLYTAVTRARRLCVLAGEEGVLAAMVAAGGRNRRFSCFADFLGDEELL